MSAVVSASVKRFSHWVTSTSTSTFLTSTSTFLDDVKEWSGPFFDTQQLGVRLNFDVNIKSAIQTDEVEVDVTQCENRFRAVSSQARVSQNMTQSIAGGSMKD